MSNDGRLYGWTGSAWVPIKLDATGRMYIDPPPGGGSGAPAWQAVVTPAIELTNRLTARLADIAAGFAISDQPFTGRIAQSPALAIVATVDGTPAVPPLNPAFALTDRISSGVAASQLPAAEIVRVQLDLVHRSGGVVATTTGPGWTNSTNAQGLNNATVATNTGAALDPALATLKLDYADLADKSSLTLSAVRLIFYSQLSLVVLNDSTVTFEYSLDNGAGWTVLQTVTADYNDLAAGRVFTLPLPTWAQVQALEARMTVDFPELSTLKTLTIDAIELEVTAAETWLP